MSIIPLLDSNHLLIPRIQIDNIRKDLLSFALLKNNVFVALLVGFISATVMAVGARYSVWWFSRKQKQFWTKKLYHVYRPTLRCLWAKYEGRAFSGHVPHFFDFTRSPKKFSLNLFLFSADKTLQKTHAFYVTSSGKDKLTKHTIKRVMLWVFLRLIYGVCLHIAFDFSGAEIRQFDYVRPKCMNVMYFKIHVSTRKLQFSRL